MSSPNTVETIFRLTKEGTGSQEAAADIKSVGKAADETSVNLEHLKSSLEKIAAGLALEKIIDVSVEAFKELDQAIAKLNGSLHSTGQFSEEYSTKLQGLARELSEVSRAETSAILNTEALLVSFGAKKENIKQLTEAVLDLSALFGNDLNRATMVVSAALQGQFAPAMRELRFQTDENKTATENFAALLLRIEQVAGGQAKVAIKSLSGELDQQKKIMKELAEVIGHTLVTSYLDLGKVIQDAYATLDFKNFDAEKKSVQENIALYEHWRAVLERLANQMEAIGAISEKQRADMVNTMSKAAGPFYNNALRSIGDIHQAERDLEFMKQILTLTDNALHPGQNRGASPDGRSEGPIQGPPIYVPDPDVVKKSLAELNKLREQYRLAGLEGIEKERAALLIKDSEEAARIIHLAHMAEISDDDKKARLAELDDATLKSLELLDTKQAQADGKRIEKIRDVQFQEAQAHDAAVQLKNDMVEIAKQGEQAFASGLAGAIVDAFSEGDKAFQKFAANFLKSIAQMILQSLILRAVQGAFGGALADGGQVHKAADGYMGMVNQPTLMPRFNVLAGEAGPELLTVMRGPRLFASGGITGIQGGVNGRQMVVTDASQLHGGGGALSIQVTLSPGLEAQITQNSIAGAAVHVAQAMTEDTPISRATRRLVS